MDTVPTAVIVRSVSERREFEKDVVALMPKLRNYAHSLTHSRDTAEDLVQQALLQGIQAQDRFRPGSNLGAWMIVILRNIFLSQQRQYWKKKRVVMETKAFENVADSDDAAYQKEVHRDFCHVAPLLAYLDPEQSDTLVATTYLEMSYEDVAANMDIAVGTVKSRVSRSSIALRALFRNETHADSIDISSWAHAARNISASDSYYPIAKAYEELYVIIMEQRRLDHAANACKTSKPKELSTIDKIWRELDEAGELEDEAAQLAELEDEFD